MDNDQPVGNIKGSVGNLTKCIGDRSGEDSPSILWWSEHPPPME